MQFAGALLSGDAPLPYIDEDVAPVWRGPAALVLAAFLVYTTTANITGYAEDAAIDNGHLEPGMHMLTKPFAVHTLAARVRELLRS